MKKITKQILVLTFGLLALTSLALFAYEAPKDPPGRPGKVKIDDYGNSWCEISWDIPAHDGGSPITNYHTEKGIEEMDDEYRWVDSGLTGTAVNKYTVISLRSGVLYKFRVSAVNAIGTGGFSEESVGIKL